MDSEYYEWRQDLIESLPRTMLEHAKNIKLTGDLLTYTWYSKPITINYEDIWDYRHHCSKQNSPMEVLEQYIARKTPTDPEEIIDDTYWSLDDNLNWSINFYRGSHHLKKKPGLQANPKPISYEQDFIVEYQGAIMSVKSKMPCPAPSVALSHGVKYFLENIDPLFSYSEDMCITFSDPYPLLCGNKEAITRLLSKGNHPYGNLYSLRDLEGLIKEKHV